MFVEVCRVCLNGNLRMLKIHDGKLLKILEKLAGIVLNADDGLPSTVCYICVSQLQRSCRFTDMANKSSNILTQLKHSGLQATPSNVISLGLGISHNLLWTEIQNMTVLDHFNDISQVYVKQGQVKKEETTEDDRINIEKGTSCQVKVEQEHDTKADYIFKYELTLEDTSQVNVKQELVVVSEDDEDNMIIDENTICQGKQDLVQSNVTEETDEDEYKLVIEETPFTSQPPYVTFNCDRCNEKLPTRNDLNTHIRTHIGKKPHICKTCKKAFKLPYYLYRHRVEVHHDEKPFACNQCDMAFTQQGAFKKHKAEHKKKLLGIGEHICNVCNKGFSLGQSLKRHLLTHHGQKPFACKICNKGFTKKNYLIKHTAKHSK